MLIAQDFRERARKALNGKWILALVTGFIAAWLGAYTALESSAGGLNSNRVKEIRESGYIENQLLNELLFVIWSILIVFAVVILMIMVVRLILSGPVSLGYAKFNLNLVDNRNPQLTDLFSQFRYFGKGLVMQLLRWLFIYLWTLLLIIPGIVAIYKYAMAPYILCENPNMSAYDAIQESKWLMDGNKWRLFCLNFSFIGWDILCVFTLGIGYLWLKPYREAAFAAFYREIKEERYNAYSSNV